MFDGSHLSTLNPPLPPTLSRDEAGNRERRGDLCAGNGERLVFLRDASFAVPVLAGLDFVLLGLALPLHDLQWGSGGQHLWRAGEERERERERESEKETEREKEREGGG